MRYNKLNIINEQNMKKNNENKCKKCSDNLDSNNVCKSCSEKNTHNLDTKDKDEVVKIIIPRDDKMNKYILISILLVLVIVLWFANIYIAMPAFMFFLSGSIGYLFSKWYIRREVVNFSVINFVVWSNVITWILPIVGTLTGISALKFASYIPEKKKKYTKIAIISLLASFLNAFLGVVLALARI